MPDDAEAGGWQMLAWRAQATGRRAVVRAMKPSSPAQLESQTPSDCREGARCP
jgi:hypothetical protein